MLYRDTFLTALRGLSANKGRSALTMLGIIIGVGSVVLMVSIGRSFQNYILTQIASFGTTTLDIFPTGLEKFGGSLESLTFDDYKAIDALSTTQSVSPIIMVGKSVSFGKEKISPMVLGTYKEIFVNNSREADIGGLLDENDEKGAKTVSVIGSQAAEDLFGNVQALGKKVTIGSQS